MLILKQFGLIFLVVSFFFGTYHLAEADITTGLVGHYTFDEGSGTTAADTTGSNTGILIGGPTWIAGKIGSGALSFDGVDDYINAGSGSSLDDIQNQGGGMTVSFWVKPASNATKKLISKGLTQNNSGYWAISKASNTDPARLSFTKEGGTDSRLNCNSMLNTGVWQHVTLVWNGAMPFGSGVSVYKDGSLTSCSATAEGAAANSDAATNLTIGGEPGELNFADASLDDVRLYNRILSPSDISELFTYTGETAAPSTPPPVDPPTTTAPPVTPQADTLTPIISSVSASSITSTGAVVSWTTDEPSDTQIEYGLTVSYGSNTVLDSNLTTSHSQSLSALAPNSLYHYRVKSKDASNNISVSQDFIFSTPSVVSNDTDRVSLLNSSGSVMSTYPTIQACADVVIAGQTCQASAGTFSERVTVKSSGSPGSPVTFKASGAVVMQGFDITGKSYVTIDGFEITNMAANKNGINLSGQPVSYGLKIINNYIHDTAGANNAAGLGLMVSATDGAEIINNRIARTTGMGIRIHYQNPSYNLIIRGNNISYTGDRVPSIQAAGENILIENNDISHVADFVYWSSGSYGVIRNNIFHDVLNSDWSTGPHIDGVQGYGSRILVENNNLYNSGEVGANAHFALFGADGAAAGNKNALVRYNTVNGIDSGFLIVQYGYLNTWVYNNTIVKTNRNTGAFNSTIGFSNASTGGKILNNIFYDAVGRGNSLYSFSADSMLNAIADYNLGYNSISGSQCSTNPSSCWNKGYAVPAGSDTHSIFDQNPLFQSYTADTNYSNDSFSLQSSSPAINRGGALTTAVSAATNSTVLAVADAGFFQPGWAGVNPDWIAVGTTGNYSRISSINYAANTIVLSSPLSWSAGAPVWLYKNSSGVQVLYGSAPDIGAYEYQGGTNTPPPTIPITPVATTTLINAIDPLVPPPAVPPPVVPCVPSAPNVSQAMPFTRSLTFGSSGADVLALQKFLNSLGYQVALSGPGSPGNETTTFGPATQRALARFQAAKGIIPAVGYFGPITIAAVNKLVPATAVSVSNDCPTTSAVPAVSAQVAVSTFERDLTLGSTGTDVLTLQKLLNTIGYQVALSGPGSPGSETMYFGPATQRALARFQAAKGIVPAVGYFGPKTRAVVGK